MGFEFNPKTGKWEFVPTSNATSEPYSPSISAELSSYHSTPTQSEFPAGDDEEDVDGVVTFSDRDENDIRDVVPRSNDGILGSGGAGAKELNVQEQHVSNYFINVRDGGNVDFRSQDTHFHQTDHTETNDSPQEEQQEEAQETTLPRGIFDGVFDVIHTVKWLLRTLLPPRLLTYFLLLCAIFIACLNAFALLFPGGATILQTFNSPALNRLIFTPAPATTYTSDTNIPTLSFRHPVPTQESDIMPTAVEVSWRGVKALDSQLSGTLDQDFEDARSKAEKFKALNEGFVEGIESESVDHYRRLANLIADIDRTLNSEETGWFWGGGGKAKRHVRSLTKVVKEAKEGRGKEREMIARTLKGVKGDGGPVPAGICHIERALENVRDGGEGLQDQKAAMRVMCSSERRSGVRWRDVEEAISRFLNKLDKIQQAIDKSWDGAAVREQEEMVRMWAGDVMAALMELARLGREEEG